MNYIWEAVLAARENGINENNLCFMQAKNPSPYLEVSFYDLNQSIVDETEIEVNPLYRFADVLGKLIDRNSTSLAKTKEILLDVLLHYFVKLDLKSGMDKQEFYSQFILDEIKRGYFGKKASLAIGLFNRREQKYIAGAVREIYESNEYICVFTEVMKKIYKNSIVYVSRDKANEMMVYVGCKKDENEVQKVAFLIDTLLPVGEKVQIFFMEHFGILDVEETMTLDQILLI